MEKGNQHIAFNTLLALYHKELSLKEVHQCKKHLETCEVCQDVFDGIEAFDTTQLLQPQPQVSEKPLEETLLKINKQHLLQTRYKAIRGNLLKCFPFLAASVFLIFFFPLNVNYLHETNKNIQAENKLSTPIIETIQDTQTEHPNHFTSEKKSDDNLAEKQHINTNTSQPEQTFTEQPIPLSHNLSRAAIASGLVEKATAPTSIAYLAPKNNEVQDEKNTKFSHDKNLTINNLEKTKIIEIPHKNNMHLTSIQTTDITHYESTEAKPVTPKFYLQYGISHMVSAVAPVKDEILTNQRIGADTTLIGSKISEHLVDVHSSITVPDLTLGCQFNRHIGLEFGASYVNSGENLIDAEQKNHNYDLLYVTNKRFMLSPAFTLQMEKEKWRPFVRFGLAIPVEAQTQRQRISNQAELVHYLMSYLESGRAAGYDYQSNTLVQWQASLGYNAALGLRYQVNDVFDVFGTMSYTNLRMKVKTKVTTSGLITDNNDRVDLSEMVQTLTPQNHIDESANFSTVNFSLGARLNFGKW